MGEMESNVLPKNYWYKALDVSRRLSDIVYDCCPSLSDYNGVITAQNIDDIVASYYLLSGFSEENVVINSEYCGTLNGETVRHGIAEIYGIDDIDLSLSSRYNSENDTFVVSGLGCSADSSKDTIYYSNNTWIFIT